MSSPNIPQNGNGEAQPSEPQRDAPANKSAKIGICIATPLRSYSGQKDLPPAIGRLLAALARDPKASAYQFEWLAACGGIARARNNCVHEFLALETEEQQWPWLYWRDADLEDANAEAEAANLLRMLHHRQPIVGALYCGRGGSRPKWVLNWLPAAELQPEGNGLLQVAEIGAGAKLYHRKVFTEVRRLMPQIVYRERETGEMIAGYFQQCVMDGDLLSEDYFFDLLARCCKIPILADTKVRLRHRDTDGKLYPPSDWPPIPALEAAAVEA